MFAFELSNLILKSASVTHKIYSNSTNTSMEMNERRQCVIRHGFLSTICFQPFDVHILKRLCLHQLAIQGRKEQNDFENDLTENCLKRWWTHGGEAERGENSRCTVGVIWETNWNSLFATVVKILFLFWSKTERAFHQINKRFVNQNMLRTKEFWEEA